MGWHSSGASGRFSSERASTSGLVNVGPTRKVELSELGYPVCQVCGQSRTPRLPRRELDKSNKLIVLPTRGRPLGEVDRGFYAYVIADASSPPACADKTEACHLLAEALPDGCYTEVLDMERDDLQFS